MTKPNDSHMEEVLDYQMGEVMRQAPSVKHFEGFFAFHKEADHLFC